MPSKSRLYRIVEALRDRNPGYNSVIDTHLLMELGGDALLFKPSDFFMIEYFDDLRFGYVNVYVD